MAERYKKGDIKVGDIVWLSCDIWRPELCGKKLKVLNCDDNDDGVIVDTTDYNVGIYAPLTYNGRRHVFLWVQ